jgi:hypothetical protein
VWASILHERVFNASWVPFFKSQPITFLPIWHSDNLLNILHVLSNQKSGKMKAGHLSWAVIVAMIMISCTKDNQNEDTNIDPPLVIKKKVLLKDIVMPHLPSPYYHFEYNPDSLVTKVDFASGYTIYDVLYSGERVSEMRNNIIINHDTLRYSYDNGGKVASVEFINQNNVLYRHVRFTYSSQSVEKIEWDHKEGNSFVIDRTLDFSYHTDGNLKEMHEHRPSAQGSPETDYSIHYDQYDDKVNVDDYTLIHDGIHDHFLVLPNLNLQKNNPKKEWSTGNVESTYAVDYTYSYNNDNTPAVKSGDFVWTSGSQAGQRTPIYTYYSYY